MTDPVQVALRRKLLAAQAVGDVKRINILRGMMTADAAEEVPAEVQVQEEAPSVEQINQPLVDGFSYRKTWDD